MRGNGVEMSALRPTPTPPRCSTRLRLPTPSPFRFEVYCARQRFTSASKLLGDGRNRPEIPAFDGEAEGHPECLFYRVAIAQRLPSFRLLSSLLVPGTLQISRSFLIGAFGVRLSNPLVAGANPAGRAIWSHSNSCPGFRSNGERPGNRRSIGGAAVERVRRSGVEPGHGDEPEGCARGIDRDLVDPGMPSGTENCPEIPNDLRK
jgi:hypothetical protein